MKKRFIAIAAAVIIVMSLAIPALARADTGMYRLYSSEHSKVSPKRLTSLKADQSCYNYTDSARNVYSRIYTCIGSSRTKRSEVQWAKGSGGWNGGWQDNTPTTSHVFEGEMAAVGLGYPEGCNAEATLYTTP